MPYAPADATNIMTDKGRMLLWRPRLDTVCSIVVGDFGAAHWPEVLRMSQQVVDDGYELLSFYDWHEMTGYVPEARTELTIWSLANKKKLHMAHIWVKHRIVAAGVSVAGALVRNLKAYTDRGPFETAYAQAMRITPLKKL